LAGERSMACIDEVIWMAKLWNMSRYG